MLLAVPAHTVVGVPGVIAGAGVTVMVAVPAVKPDERIQPLASVTLTIGNVLVDAMVPGVELKAVPLTSPLAVTLVTPLV